MNLFAYRKDMNSLKTHMEIFDDTKFNVVDLDTGISREYFGASYPQASIQNLQESLHHTINGGWATKRTLFYSHAAKAFNGRMECGVSQVCLDGNVIMDVLPTSRYDIHVVDGKENTVCDIRTLRRNYLGDVKLQWMQSVGEYIRIAFNCLCVMGELQNCDVQIVIIMKNFKIVGVEEIRMVEHNAYPVGYTIDTAYTLPKNLKAKLSLFK